MLQKSLDLKETETGRNTPSEGVGKRNDEASIINSPFMKPGEIVKYNSPSTWEGCQWRYYLRLLRPINVKIR